MLNINRHNYEEYFILYLDNELDAADRKVVDAFVNQHPDLKEELELLGQFRLEPETDIVHPDKTSLLKNAVDREFSMEQLLLHLDNELEPTVAAELDKAIERFPQLRKTYSELQQARLEPEHILFPDKTVLYRKEEPHSRVISIRWYRVAAAILLLLLAGTTYLLLNTSYQKTDAPEVAKTEISSPDQKMKTEPAPNKESLPSREVADLNEARQKSIQDKETVNSNTSIYKMETNLPAKTPIAQQKEDTYEAPSNNLPEPVTNRNAIAFNENRPSQTTDPDFDNAGVTTLSPQPSNNIVRASYPNDGNEPDQEPAGGKKNKLRGLFRKVTRTFEKRTNIDATDNDERLLVAGLSIKLK